MLARHWTQKWSWRERRKKRDAGENGEREREREIKHFTGLHNSRRLGWCMNESAREFEKERKFENVQPIER